MQANSSPGEISNANAAVQENASVDQESPKNAASSSNGTVSENSTRETDELSKARAPTGVKPDSDVLGEAATAVSKELADLGADVSPNTAKDSFIDSGTTSNGATSLQPAQTKPAVNKKETGDQPFQNSISLMHSLRRSERIQKQAAKAEEARRIREERAAVEEARTKQRSIAAKKAAATKRKAQQLAKEGVEPAKLRKLAPSASGSQAIVSKQPKKVVKLRYLNVRPLPEFSAINLKENSSELFWLRLNLREFLLRFDKLCRLPVRFAAGLNNPLEPYTPEQLKSIALALLKLIGNDSTPLHDNAAGYVAEIDALEATNPIIWDWLLDFVEQIDAYAPHEVPTTEEEQLELLRRLMVICTGTETIRITVMTDMDQLKWVEKDSQDEIKAIGIKFKEIEAKLLKLKKADKEVWQQKLDAAQRSTDNKIWRSQQQLFIKVHKYSMRTSPIYVDTAGNRYWSFQYKSSAHTDWGSWIICEIVKRPTDMLNWYKKVGKEVNSVLKSRDELINQKNVERKLKREEIKEAKKESASENATTDAADKATGAANFVPLAPNVPSQFSQPANSQIKVEESLANSGNLSALEEKPKLDDTADLNSRQSSVQPDSKQKRRYPKLKLTPLPPMKETELYYVAGRDNILALAHWLNGFPGADPKAISEIENVATYFATDT